MSKDGKRFKYLIQKLPCMNEAKIKEVIFIGLKTKQLFQDPILKNKLNVLREVARDAFENIFKNLSETETLKIMKIVIVKLFRNCEECTPSI